MESTCKRLLDYCVGGKATHGFTNSKSTSDVLQITLCAPRLQTLLPRSSVDISMLDLRVRPPCLENSFGYYQIPFCLTYHAL